MQENAEAIKRGAMAEMRVRRGSDWVTFAYLVDFRVDRGTTRKVAQRTLGGPTTFRKGIPDTPTLFGSLWYDDRDPAHQVLFEISGHPESDGNEFEIAYYSDTEADVAFRGFFVSLSRLGGGNADFEIKATEPVKF